MTKRFFPQLDGLRAIAALMILGHHYWPAYAWLDPSGGRLGVDLFFVLSGYLITRSLLRAQDRSRDSPVSILTDFLRRRAFRIIPVLYLTLLLSLFLRSQRTMSIGWHFAFLSNFYFIFQGHFVGANAHLWALAVEQHFYWFWPLIVLWTPRLYLPRASYAMIGTGLFFHFLAGWFGWSDLTFDIMTPGAFEALGCGTLLACWMSTREENPEPTNAWILRIGFVGLVLTILVIQGLGVKTGSRHMMSRLFTELSRSLLITWVIAQAVWGIPGWVGNVLESAFSRSLGRWSYAIYVSHNYILAMFLASDFWLKGFSLHNARALYAFAVTLVYSWACYEFIERPFLNPPPLNENTSVRSPVSI